MTGTRFSIGFALAAVIVTVVILWNDPLQMIDLWGHGLVVWWGFFIVMVAVTCTHLGLLTIMLVRRVNWLPIEGALFDFIAMDGVFWGSTAWLIRDTQTDTGVPLINIVSAALMIVASCRYNAIAVRHYILGLDDES